MRVHPRMVRVRPGCWGVLGGCGCTLLGHPQPPTPAVGNLIIEAQGSSNPGQVHPRRGR